LTPFSTMCNRSYAPVVNSPSLGLKWMFLLPNDAKVQLTIKPMITWLNQTYAALGFRVRGHRIKQRLTLAGLVLE